MPGVVRCTKCHSRFAEGVRFCGRCGNDFPFKQSTATGSLQPAGSASAIITCPRCGQEYPVGTRFCGRCGIPIGTASLDWHAPRAVEVICKHCGKSYPAATKFCGLCGNPF